MSKISMEIQFPELIILSYFFEVRVIESSLDTKKINIYTQKHEKDRALMGIL